MEGCCPIICFNDIDAIRANMHVLDLKIYIIKIIAKYLDTSYSDDEVIKKKGFPKNRSPMTINQTMEVCHQVRKMILAYLVETSLVEG